MAAVTIEIHELRQRCMQEQGKKGGPLYGQLTWQELHIKKQQQSSPN